MSQFIEMFGTSDANEKGWPISSFGKKLTITSGGTPDTQNESYWNGNISWIGSNLCQNCILKENDGKYITEEGLEHSSAKIYKPDTVLVALVGATIGKVAYLAFETSTNQNVAGIVVNDNKEFEPMFIYYLLQNMYNRFFMLGMGKFKMASLGFIKALPLMMPPLALQKQFVSIAQQADKSEFDGFKSQFIEMFDFENNSHNWSVMSFNDFASLDCTMTTDYDYYADYPHIGIDSIEQNTGRLYGYRTVKEDNVKSGKYIFTPNHIIYSKIRPNLNKVAVPDFDGLCSADSYPILPNNEVTSKDFLVYLLRSDVFLRYIIPLSNRTGMPKVNREQVEGFACPLPPKSEQSKFVTIYHQADKSESLYQIKIAS